MHNFICFIKSTVYCIGEKVELTRFECIDKEITVFFIIQETKEHFRQDYQRDWLFLVTLCGSLVSKVFPLLVSYSQWYSPAETDVEEAESLTCSHHFHHCLMVQFRHEQQIQDTEFMQVGFCCSFMLKICQPIYICSWITESDMLLWNPLGF